MKKPKLWSLVVVTVIYAISALIIYSGRSDTLTTGRRLINPLNPYVVEMEPDDALEITDLKVDDTTMVISLKALKECDFCRVSIINTETGRSESIPFQVSEDMQITDLNTNNKHYSRAFMTVSLLWVWSLAVCFIVAYFRQLKYSIFSYNTIIYFGFGLYVTTIALHATISTLPGLISYADLYMYGFTDMLAEAGTKYAEISFPFLLIMTIGLIISNIVLLRREGRSFTNLVGTIQGIFLTAADIAVYYSRMLTSSNWNIARIQFIFINGIAALFLYFECMWIGAMAAGLVAASKKADTDRDYLIILGCGFRKDGTLTPLLKGRCDQAVQHYFKQKEAGRTPKIITSGGQGPDEIISESEAMKRYLLTCGIPETDIIMEDRSETTMENFRFSREKMDIENAKTAFFTTKYHVFRSGIWARRAGFARTAIQGEGSPTRWYFWPNAFVREFAGLMVSHRLKQTLICIAIMVIQALLTWIFLL